MRYIVVSSLLLALFAALMLSCGVGGVGGSDEETQSDERLPFAFGEQSSYRVKVATYNIHGPGYVGMTGAQRSARLSGTADLLQATGAEVIVLQEVDRGRPGSGYLDMTHELERRLEQRTKRTWYTFYSPGCTPWDGGSGGQAILSTAPLSQPRSIHLSGAKPGGRCDNYSRCKAKRNPALDWIPRQGVAAETHGVTVVGVHLTAGQCDAAQAVRKAEVAALKKRLHFSEPMVLAGDLNDKDPFVASQLGAFQNTSKPVTTSKAGSSNYKIDHVLTYGGAVGVASTATVSGTGTTSDHLVISAAVDVKRRAFRALDTRSKTHGAAPVPSGNTRCVKVAGLGGVPTSARAVFISLVAVAPSGNGYLTVHPGGTPRPGTSSVNYATGDTTTNGVLAEVGTQGRICVFASRATHVIVDVFGYFRLTADFQPMRPYRRYDTRTGAPRPSGSRACFHVAGHNGVPTSAKAVAINIVAVAPSGPGHLKAHGKNRSAKTSVLNYVGGRTIANGAIVEIGDGGEICVYVSRTTHVVGDIVGFFGANSNYSPLGPFRRVDTRGATLLHAGRPYCYVVAGRDGVPSAARAIAINLVSVASTGNGWMVAYPYGHGRPHVSNLNFRSGVTRAANALVQPGIGGKICVYSSVPAHHIIDVTGFSM